MTAASAAGKGTAANTAAASAARNSQLVRPLRVALAPAQRTALAPGLPTISESGVPGYENAALFMVFAPAKTSGALIARLNREVVGWVRRPDTMEKFFNGGAEVIASSPQELAVAMKAGATKETLIEQVRPTELWGFAPTFWDAGRTAGLYAEAGGK